MPRGNWHFIVAVVGIAILAPTIWLWLEPRQPVLPQYQQAEPKQSHYQAGGSGCNPTHLRSLTGPKAIRERDRCAEASENHRLQSDDLIQQTRAANASQVTALLTYDQSRMILAGTMIGLFTLIAAGFAAWYARGAFKEAQRGSNAAEDALAHAQKVAASELRPWVSLRLAPRFSEREQNRFSIEIDIIAENLGQTVAKNCQLHFTLLFGEQVSSEVIQGWWRKWGAEKTVNRKVLMPREVETFHWWHHHSIADLPWTVVDGESRVGVVLVVSVSYQSDNGLTNVWHQTDRAFTIGRKTDSLTRTYLCADDLNLGPDDIIIRPYSGNLAD